MTPRSIVRFELPPREKVQGVFSPLIALDLRRQRMRRRTMVMQFGTLLMRCRSCGELLPFDTEFFYAQAHTDGGLRLECRACCQSLWRERDARARAAVSGAAA